MLTKFAHSRFCCIQLIERMRQLFRNLSGRCGNVFWSPFNSRKNVLNTIERRGDLVDKAKRPMRRHLQHLRAMTSCLMIPSQWAPISQITLEIKLFPYEPYKSFHYATLLVSASRAQKSCLVQNVSWTKTYNDDWSWTLPPNEKS